MRVRDGNSIRVLLANDHPVERNGLATLLLESSDMVLVGQAQNAVEALALCATTVPDVVLMDLLMPEMDSIGAIRVIHDNFPDTKVIILTNWTEHGLVQHAMAAGAEGYVLKDVGATELAEAIRMAHAATVLAPALSPYPGEDLTGPERDVLALMKQGLNEAAIGARLSVSIQTVEIRVNTLLLKLDSKSRDARPKASESPRPGVDLTGREREVLALMTRGWTNIQIGAQLAISRATVKFHVSNILGKLGVATRTEAVAHAVQHHLTTPAD